VAGRRKHRHHLPEVFGERDVSPIYEQNADSCPRRCAGSARPPTRAMSRPRIASPAWDGRDDLGLLSRLGPKNGQFDAGDSLPSLTRPRSRLRRAFRLTNVPTRSTVEPGDGGRPGTRSAARYQRARRAALRSDEKSYSAAKLSTMMQPKQVNRRRS
jgi:hypothetical protein